MSKYPKLNTSDKAIRFRAWVPHSGMSVKSGMYQVSDLAWYTSTSEGRAGEVFYKGQSASDYIEDVVLMQSTGLRDRNGTEIYEGDIISCVGGYEDWESDADAVVTFERGCFRAGDCNLYDFDISAVVGNIYENPGLIEKRSAGL